MYVGKVHRNTKAYGDTPHLHPHPQIFLSSLSDYNTNMISVKDGYFDQSDSSICHKYDNKVNIIIIL